ncbi:NADH:flavin oxidoreductase/NADH oxidase family protein [Flexivirga meconopsidis]|uniref:NADH:flavin oxidoreductase/NADH oxidase family protein n=1 Tax=Flexivirga meconopsidis TaxID=2977121 RepID=UPI00223F8E3F|nr:NADH:flavin oxidoreductase/NADH oxidase family protein [Flexivirga meconopsidis]
MTDLAITQPLTLPCGAQLPNRIAKAAMSEQLAARDGGPTDKLRRLYGVWGHSGAGLLLSGNMMIDRRALTEPGNVILDDDRHLDDVRAWTGAATACGAHFWAQINHPGKVAVAPFDKRPVAPSALRSTVPGYNLRQPRALSGTEIQEVIERFRRTARLAIDGGFTGVQVHAAHGYLLSQFLSPQANKRDDEWGGDAQRRRRLLLEVVDAVRAEVGRAIPVGVKLNSTDFVRGGFSSDEAADVAVALGEVGVDLLEISGGGYEQPAMTGVARAVKRREGYFHEFAAQVRAASDVPLMLTGGMRSPDYMNEVIEDGTVDVIGVGRPLAFAPDFPRRVLAGESVRLPASPRRLGFSPLDGYNELAWHNVQLHRIAAGKTPQARPGIHTLARAVGRITVAGARQVTVPS